MKENMNPIAEGNYFVELQHCEIQIKEMSMATKVAQSKILGKVRIYLCNLNILLCGKMNLIQASQTLVSLLQAVVHNYAKTLFTLLVSSVNLSLASFVVSVLLTLRSSKNTHTVVSVEMTK